MRDNVSLHLEHTGLSPANVEEILARANADEDSAEGEEEGQEEDEDGGESEEGEEDGDCSASGDSSSDDDDDDEGDDDDFHASVRHGQRLDNHARKRRRREQSR